MGIAANVWQFFAFRALMGAFAGFSSAAIALVASQVPEGRLGFALGWLIPASSSARSWGH